MPVRPHDRGYLQARLREELERSRRYGREFSLLVLEAASSNDGVPLRKRISLTLAIIARQLRSSDVLARVFEDTIAVLLVETDERGAADALHRIRSRIGVQGGTWRVSLLSYPRSREAIEGHVLLNVA